MTRLVDPVVKNCAVRESRPILLTSLPRSGSTWVMKMLAAGPGIFPLFEPDHLPEWGFGEEGMHPYIRPGQEWNEYQCMYERIFKGRPRQGFTPSYRYIGHLKRRIRQAFTPHTRVLVKSVFSIQNTPWIYERFRPRVIVLLRNPYGVIHSIHRRWPDARLKVIIDQDSMMEDYLEPYRGLMESARAPYEVLAAHVGAYYRIIQTAAESNNDWIVVKHEDLCRDPISGFRNIYNQLGMCWSEKVEARIQSANQPKIDDAVQHVRRLASEEIDKWRSLMTAQEINQISSYYDGFDNKWYTGLAGNG